jgi:hypothetical protein
MKQWIAIAAVLALTIGLAIAVAGRLKSEPKTAPRPSESAISKVIQTFNEEERKHWRRTGGDLATGYINLGDYYDYLNVSARPVDDPFLATMEIRPRDTDGFLFTADISAGNYLTRRATPFAKSRSGHVCLDFDRAGEVIKRKLDLATYHC